MLSFELRELVFLVPKRKMGPYDVSVQTALCPLNMINTHLWSSWQKQN